MKSRYLLPFCAIHLSLALVACQPAAVIVPRPQGSSTPTPLPSPVMSPSQTPAVNPVPGDSSSPGSSSPVPTSNPASGVSSTIRLPNGSKLVISLGNRFLEAKGQTIQLQLSLTDADGKALELSSLKYLFSSNRPQDIAVDDKGLITALVDQGFAEITVVVEGTELKATQLVSVNAIDISGGGGGTPKASPTASVENLKVNVNFEGLNLFGLQVSSQQTNDQFSPAIAMDDDGDFVVVWRQEDSSDDRILAQRYSSTGYPMGAEISVNSDTNISNSAAPSVAMDDDGDFVVTWMVPDSEHNGIAARRFNSQGIAQGIEFLVNTTTSNNQLMPKVAMDADGDFTIVWQSSSNSNNYIFNGSESIYFQRYNSLGVAQGSEFLVNTENTEYVGFANLAMDDEGDFVVTWHAGAENNSNYDLDVFAKRYDSSGGAIASEFQVNVHNVTTEFHAVPTVAMDADGDFIVTWTRAEYDDYSPDRALEIVAKRYNSVGGSVGSEFVVNNDQTLHRGVYSNIAMDDDGDFVVNWMEYSEWYFGGASILAKRYNRSGIAQSSSFISFKNSGGFSSYDRGTDVAMDADGDFAIPTVLVSADVYNSSVSVKLYSPTGQLKPNPGQNQ